MIRQCLRLWSYLAPMHRLGAIALAAGNLLASVMEVVALALFAAVLLRLTQGGAPAVNPGLAWASGFVVGADLRWLTLACAGAYAGKNALMLALSWLEARLTFGIQAHVSGLALAAMMRQDFEEASRVSQSTNINLLTGGMFALAANVLLPGLAVLGEAMLMLALVLFLVLTQPAFVAGMLATLSLVAGVLVLVSRRMVLQIGVARQRTEDDRLQLLSGIFGHLREMYVYSAGPRAVAHLQSLLAHLAANYRAFQLLQNAPRYLLEIALVGVVMGVVFWHAGGPLDSGLVVSIGVFGMAGFRLLLGINRIVGCVQAMRFAGPAVDRIVQALSIPARPDPGAGAPLREGTPSFAGLRLVGLSYAYDARKPVLQGIDVTFPGRALVAIRGRSGAGKTTLLEILAGLRTPAEGWVELDGRRITDKQQLAGRVAYAGQQPAVFPDTIRANVAFGRDPAEIDDKAVWRALRRAHLDEAVRLLPGGLDYRFGFGQALSGGQIQRLALARALYRGGDYLLLDEPTAALDAETEMQLLATLREVASSTLVIVVSHRPAPIDAADLVLEVKDGRLVHADAQFVPMLQAVR